ncbi:Nuclear factor 1 X-type [Trichinella spiralis]|uniref:Nuclear factor 1 X-type n=1 Tax=Trichinella spiralis TaxID=6334 RepID=A0ABR3KJ41_TRISP
MAGSFFFRWKINGRKRHRNQLSLAEMSNVDKWSVQVERPLQLSVSDGLVKKRARLLALWFCFVTPVRCSARFFSLPNFCYRHHHSQHQAILSRATSVLILKLYCFF